jgi:hypothetical protein
MRRYGTLCDVIRRYATIRDATWRYSTLLVATRRCSTLLILQFHGAHGYWTGIWKVLQKILLRLQGNYNHTITTTLQGKKWNKSAVAGKKEADQSPSFFPHLVKYPQQDSLSLNTVLPLNVGFFVWFCSRNLCCGWAAKKKWNMQATIVLQWCLTRHFPKYKIHVLTYL